MNEQIPAPVASAAAATDEVPVGEHTRIRGWLLLFLVLAVIIDVGALAMLMYEMMSGPFYGSISKSQNVSEISIFVFLIQAACVMTVLVIRAFRDRRPDAVFLGRHLAMINAVPAAYLVAASIHAGFTVCHVVASILFYATIFYRFYFNNSSLVKALIPPATRKVSNREKYLVSFVYAVFGVVFCTHSGFDHWWWIVFGLLGLLSFSPLMDSPSDLGEPEKEE